LLLDLFFTFGLLVRFANWKFVILNLCISLPCMLGIFHYCISFKGKFKRDHSKRSL